MGIKWVSPKELADEVGKSYAFILKCRKEGQIRPESWRHNGRGYVFNKARAIRDMEANLRHRAPNKRDSTIAEAGFEHLTFNEARTALTKYRASREKIQYQKDRGELIELETVNRELFHVCRQVRDSILAIPARIAAVLAVEDSQHSIEVMLKDELSKALEDLADEYKPQRN